MDLHAAEAKERWGDTDAYKESATRTARYTKADWEQVGAEAAEINQAMLALMSKGVPADSVVAMDVAEQHRAHISKWFYDCPPQMHTTLGEMYVADQRFTANLDRAVKGLAEYLSAAIAANAVRD